jgi:hypothetical protein
MISTQSAALIIRGRFKNLTVGFLPKKRVLTICSAFGGPTAFAALVMVEVKLGQPPEAFFDAQLASGKHRLPPVQSLRERGSHCVLGFRLCGL